MVAFFKKRVPADMMTSVKSMLAGACAMVLAGCATVDRGGSDLAAVAPDNGPQQEVFGTGNASIGLILPLFATTSNRNDLNDYLAGARHAVDVLGGDQIRLVVRRTDGSLDDTTRAVTALTEQNAQIILGGTNPSNVAALAERATVPMIGFVTNDMPSGNNRFAFLDDQISGLSEATRATIATGRRTFAILKPETYPASALTRLSANIIEQGGRVNATIDLKNTGQSDVIEGQRAALNGVAAFIVLGSSVEAGPILTALKQDAAIDPKTILVEERSITAQSAVNPVFDSVIFARLPINRASPVAASFNNTFNRPLSPSAAYGFDAVAMVIGLNRSGKLGEGVSEALVDPHGFRALTGVFRFKQSGHVERRHEIYHLADQRPVLLQEQGTGF